MENMNLKKITTAFAILSGALGCGVKAPSNQATQVESAPAAVASAPVQVEVLNYVPQAALYLHGNNDWGNIESPAVEAVVSWDSVTNPNDHEITVYAQPDSAFEFTAAFRTRVSTTLGFNIPPLEEMIYGLYRPKWTLTKVKVRDELDHGQDVPLENGIFTFTVKPRRTVTLGWVAGVASNEKTCVSPRALLVPSQYSRYEFVKIVGQSLGYLIQREYRQDDGQGGQVVVFQSTTQNRVSEGEVIQSQNDNLIRLNGTLQHVQSCDKIILK